MPRARLSISVLEMGFDILIVNLKLASAHWQCRFRVFKKRPSKRLAHRTGNEAAKCLMRIQKLLSKLRRGPASSSVLGALHSSKGNSAPARGINSRMIQNAAGASPWRQLSQLPSRELAISKDPDGTGR